MKIKNFELDSLSHFQIKQFLNQNSFTSIEIAKSDISVYLELPSSYESYLRNLSKKNRHELKRKKRIFEERFGETVFEKSKDIEIFNKFVSLHKKSLGEKGGYMTQLGRILYSLKQENWYIYYIIKDDSMVFPHLYMSQKQQIF